MLHSTKGIVLRNVRYGETSLVVMMYTELFGVQSYLVQGVRSEKKSATKAGLLQPSNILDMVVYHQPNKNLQRLKEFRLSYWSEHTADLVRNSIKMFSLELFSKLITQPEPHPELFYYYEQFLQEVDQKNKTDLANHPLHFMLNMAEILGFGIQGQHQAQTPVLDLQNGSFLSVQDVKHFDFVADPIAKWISNLIQHPQIKFLAHERKQILDTLIKYVQIHHPENMVLKSPDILHELLNE